MEQYLPLLMTAAVNFIGVGAFYGAVKAELWWIKRAIERLENKWERQGRN
ncbi:MAG: hypothetical protein OXR68_00060 [Alphaproteobacteria bacterium]|nr:hypothetical protein [Alphaproteobacteria bacterium]MDD9919004.1 hypothetical protein [Alphaproteobacteria bacterium]